MPGWRIAIGRIVGYLTAYLKGVVTERDKLLVLASAILLSAGFAPLPFGFLAYICLIPLIIACNEKSFRSGFKLGYLFGFELTVFSLYWVAAFTFNSSKDIGFIHPMFSAAILGILAFLAMAVLHSLFYAAIVGAFCALYKRSRFFVFALPAIWVSVEYLRTLSQFAFPWSNLSYTQSYYLPLIQSADLWGDIGISFWIVLINVFLYTVYVHRKRLVLALPPMILTAVVFLGAMLYDDGPREYKTDLKVALIQGNFTLKEKWTRSNRERNIEVYDSLSRVADSAGAQLIIWPETSAPMYLEHQPKYYHWIRSLAIDLKNYILVGTLIAENFNTAEERHYNGCYQFTPQGQMQIPYKKSKLVPFSERVPYNEYLGPINKIQLGQSNFAIGDSLVLFDHPGGEYGVLICFELAFSDLMRDFVNSGADFMATITNDTWFGETSGPYQHMQMAPYRAIEARSWVVRSANSGFSFIADPYGRKYGRTDLYERTIVYGEIGRIEDKTFFVRHGQWLPQICLGLSFLFLFCLLIVKIPRRRNDQ